MLLPIPALDDAVLDNGVLDNGVLDNGVLDDAVLAAHRANLDAAIASALGELRTTLADTLATLSALPDPGDTALTGLIARSIDNLSDAPGLADVYVVTVARGIVGLLADVAGSARSCHSPLAPILDGVTRTMREAAATPDRYTHVARALTSATANSLATHLAAAAIRAGDPAYESLLDGVDLASLASCDRAAPALLADAHGLPVPLVESLAAVPGLSVTDALAAAAQAAQ
jgi:hypothetical protein